MSETEHGFTKELRERLTNGPDLPNEIFTPAMRALDVVDIAWDQVDYGQDALEDALIRFMRACDE